MWAVFVNDNSALACSFLCKSRKLTMPPTPPHAAPSIATITIPPPIIFKVF